MRDLTIHVLVASLALCGPALAAGPAGEAGPQSDRRIVVRLQPGATLVADRQGRLAIDAPGGRLVGMARLASAAILAEVRAFAPCRIAPAPRRPEVAARVGLDRYWTLDLPAGTDTVRLATRLAALGTLVDHAEPDGVGGTAADLPNDPSFFLQYGLHNTGQTIGGIVGVPDADIDAPEAWSILPVGAPPTIAVLDSGIDQHVELSGRLLPGVNVPDGTTITADECAGHGTHVAGILAATRDNGVGIAGIADEALLKPWVVVDGCTGFESWVATALTQAADEGHRLVSMSLQYYTGTAALRSAVKYAAELGVIMVAAAGNNGNANVAFPGRWPETICVAALRPDDQPWPSSNFGPSIEFAAAGVSVYSLSGTSSYANKSGTSMAVPHVTGTIALMLARNPNLTLAEVRAILAATATDVFEPGFDQRTGFGRINAYAALLATPLPGDLDGDGAIGPTDLAILLGSWGPCDDCDGECLPDLDGDCQVGAADLAILLGAWTG
jgi:thermitase